ncbi:nucleotidyltransferase domain-containing protein [Burkholderia sp. Ac-20384]|nr:nucleotidyltransferase domain-containing protein [Burkholderia sp. Ac-20384]
MIRKVWLFGSRVCGTERPDSDIDIAVEIERLAGDSCKWRVFVFERQRLNAAIEALLPMPVQLEWYGGPTETPTIEAGLRDNSILVYQAV